MDDIVRLSAQDGSLYSNPLFIANEYPFRNILAKTSHCVIMRIGETFPKRTKSPN